MNDFEVRAVRETDLEFLHRLNQSEVPHVGSIDFDRIRRFAREASYFRVAAIRGEIVGFVIALLPTDSYDSPNFLWFCERSQDFVYVDRIAVATSARRRGVARALYADVEAFALERGAAVTCEVNVLPPNPASMEAHGRLGFVEVGRLEHEPGAKVVAMMRKEIRSKADAGPEVID